MCSSVLFFKSQVSFNARVKIITNGNTVLNNHNKCAPLYTVKYINNYISQPYILKYLSSIVCLVTLKIGKTIPKKSTGYQIYFLIIFILRTD